MNRQNNLTRRNFLRNSATALAMPTLIRASALGADGNVAPSNRVVAAVIGRGAMGRGHVNQLIYNREFHALAVCDADKTRALEGKESVEARYADDISSGKYSGCIACTDYRELLERKDLDAVIIATPDHWHTPIAVHAAKAGKDVYCEKPVSMTLHQGRELVTAITAQQRVFQTGTQYRSMKVLNEGINFVRAGGLGRVKSVFTIWGYHGIPTQDRSRIPGNPILPEEPLPEGLDWDLWVGPAAWHPYNRAYHRNPIPGVVPWAFCEDFGLGCSTYYHSHAADVIQYALKKELTNPVEIIHPNAGSFPTLTCRYDDGTLLHHVDNWQQMKELYKDIPQDAPIHGAFGGVFVGERGWISLLYDNGKNIEASDESFFAEMKLKNRAISGANNHHANWLECIKTRVLPSAHAEIGHRTAALGQLVIMCWKLGRSLTWDPVKEVFPDDDAANRLCSRALRSPWKL